MSSLILNAPRAFLFNPEIEAKIRELYFNKSFSPIY